MKIEFPSAHHIPELKRLWARCFPDPKEFIDGFFSSGFSTKQCRILTEEKALASLYWFDASFQGQKLAYLYAIATDPGHRGQGLCRRLMEDTHTLLKNQGYAASLLLPGEPELRNMYRKFGYQDQCAISKMACTAQSSVSAKEIPWEEYARLRPDFLPEDGADQEGLSFLATYARFYLGQNWLLAAVQEDGTLLGLELLGSTKAAPGILTALNCQKGTFRSPGTAKQTVMALPLTDDVKLPKYFGLTFD